MQPPANQIPLLFQFVPNGHIFSDIPAFLHEKKNEIKDVLNECVMKYGISDDVKNDVKTTPTTEMCVS